MKHLRNEINRDITADLARLLSLADDLRKHLLDLRRHTAARRFVGRHRLRTMLCSAVHHMVGCGEKEGHDKAILVEELRRHMCTHLEQLQRRTLCRTCLRKCHADRLTQTTEQGEQQILLRVEIIVKGSDAEICCTHDVRNRRVLVALLRELTDCRLENHSTRLQLLAFPAAHFLLQKNFTLSFVMQNYYSEK